VTGLCVLAGWRAAVQRRFAEHRDWMWPCFLLLCSAVVLRVIGGAATVAGVSREWTYQFAAWASWLAPLAVLELGRRFPLQSKSLASGGGRQSKSLSTALSPPAMEISARR
jgi:hypothetical protein